MTTPDPSDRASELEEMARLSAMTTSKHPNGPVPMGRCHYCGERVAGMMRWCDADCRNEWVEEQDIKRRTGR